MTIESYAKLIMTRDLSPEVRRYLANDYPHNHNYRIVGGRLWPNWQLFRRAVRIRALYPVVFDSLVDLSVSKGYFALHAAMRPDAPRVVGIDVNAAAVEATRAAAGFLGLDNVRVEVLRLHELASSVGAFGGACQTALLINMYQYLYFGGVTEPDYYQSHDEIFSLLREICSGTLVFSNCVEFDRLPGWVRRTALEQDRAAGYTPAAIRSAAENYFHVSEHGSLGRRPLWALTPR